MAMASQITPVQTNIFREATTHASLRLQYLSSIQLKIKSPRKYISYKFLAKITKNHYQILFKISC